ncbi:MAG: hypothetical protein ABSH28_09520, partial [Acidobacteriota bacterium]
FHEFQPIGGVCARLCSAPTIVNCRLALPRSFAAVSSTSVVPGFFREPEMMPVCGLSSSPSGRFLAENLSGGRPVAGTRNRNGLPGVAPAVLGPFIAGFGDVPRAKTGGGGKGGDVV